MCKRPKALSKKSLKECIDKASEKMRKLVNKKKTITMKPFVSSCCKGGFKVVGNPKEAWIYECLLCGKSCDIESFKKLKPAIDTSYEGIQKEFFNKLAEKLEECFPKGELCSHCGKKSFARSRALSFNAFANLYFRELLKKGLSQNASNGEENMDWEKSIKKWIVHILFGASTGKYKEKTTGELADRILKGIKQFITEELAEKEKQHKKDREFLTKIFDNKTDELLKQKDKEFFGVLEGLKMGERRLVAQGTTENDVWRTGANWAIKEFNNKIKQIKKKYENNRYN